MRVRSRNERDMMVLGGWLFADLLLGLAMLFFTANTVGAPDPSPTVPATPNQLATANARAARTATVQAGQVAAALGTSTVAAGNLASAQMTSTTLAGSLAGAEQTATAAARDSAAAATATTVALLTREAMSAEERATADALATRQAISSEATISAFATQAAQNQADIDAQTRALATAAAEATAMAAAARGTIEAQATANAQVASIATENARNGANDLATALANADTSQSAAKTAQAQAANARRTVEAAGLTVTVLADLAANNVIDPNYTEITFNVNAQGLINGNPTAVANARAAIQQELAPYFGCRVGFALTSSGGTFEEGVAVANAVNDILTTYFFDQFGEGALEGFSTVRENDLGLVNVRIYFFEGCGGNKTPTPTITTPQAVLPPRSG